MRIRLSLPVTLLLISISAFGQNFLKIPSKVDTPGDIPICVKSGDQINPACVGDDKGGYFVVWQNGLGDNYATGGYVRDSAMPKIQAQRIDASGRRLWGASGVRVSLDTTYQTSPTIVSDNNGGAIIEWANTVRTWTEGSSYPTDRYNYAAQRIDANGNLLWTTEGVTILNGVTSNSYHETRRVTGIGSDDSGGALFTFYDWQQHFSTDFLADRISSEGILRLDTVGPYLCWVGLSSEQYTGGFSSPHIVSNISGGGIFSWAESDGYTSTTLKVISLDSTGRLMWSNQPQPKVDWNLTGGGLPFDMCSDGAGGVYICWILSTTGVLSAQWIDNTGNENWGANGRTICNLGVTPDEPQIAANPAGGAFVAWKDFRDGPKGELYAARINRAGDIPWTNNGIPVCLNDSVQIIYGINCRSSESIFITWRNNDRVHAQLLNGSGDAQWMANGVVVGSNEAKQDQAALCGNNSGRTIVVWQDSRNGIDPDIYGQWIDASVAPQLVR